MSKTMKRNTYVFSAALAGLLAVYTPFSWSSDDHEQHVQKSTQAAGQPDAMKGMDHGSMKGMDHSKMKGMDHDAMKGMDHGKMKGMDHDAMKGMDHGKMKGMDHDAMKGMDHRKMMESQGGDKAKAGKDDQ